MYRIMQIVHGGKLSRFSRISLQSQRFSSKFFFFCIIRCFELLYNRESFTANNKKIMEPRIFSTTNDLYYTVVDLLLHVGRGSDHTPIDGSSLNTHSLTSAPSSIKSGSHVWVTTDPNVLESPVVVPLSGIPGSPQTMTMYVMNN